MATTFDSEAFDRCTDPVLRLLTMEQAHEILRYDTDESLRQRIEELAGKSNEGQLTESERAEYQAYVRANKFVAILQAKARKILENANA